MKHRQCLRCGRHIKEETNRLWCDKCIIRVNEELEGKADRNYEYYFRHHLKQMRKTFTQDKNV
jgi:NMD protein affecting ribosome stability and mRNA decay